MSLLARVLAGLSLGAGVLVHTKIRSGALDPSLFVYAGKVLSGACAPAFGVAGAAATILGMLEGDPTPVVAGLLGAALSAHFVDAVSKPHDGFERAFGADWEAAVPPRLAGRLLARRRYWCLPLAGRPQHRRNIAFWTVPGTDRDLLCDIWEPPDDVARSGLGVIYLHAGGWQNFDKDTGTRPFFRYLAGQGHVVMDVAYRMCPETDMPGMLGDVKRAIAWLKTNAGRYQVDPAYIVLAGASAGAQLALLAAFTPNQSCLDPQDVRPADTSVRGVISFYGPVDMLRYSEGVTHADWPLFVRLGRKAGIVQRGPYLDWPCVERRLFGAPAHEVAEWARYLSPIAHVGPGCPPTLLIHGRHDRIVPAGHSRELYQALRGQGVPVVYLELPLVDHAFDLPLLRLSPPAQAALYDVERFLALMAGSRDFGNA